MSYTSPIQHTHIPGGLGSRTSPIIMHIPGGVVPIYPGIWAPAQLHPTPTHPGVWCPSTRGSEVLHIPHPTPTHLGVWGPAPPPSSRAYPWVWGPPHPTSNTHIPRGLGSCTSPIQYPHTGVSGSCSPPSNTHIPGGLMPTYLGIRAPGHLILAPTYPRLWCPPTQGSGVLLASLQHPQTPQMRHPRTQGPRSPPHTALTGRQLRLGDPRRSCPSLLALSSPRSAPSGTTKHPQQASKREGKEENKPDPPPQKGRPRGPTAPGRGVRAAAPHVHPSDCPSVGQSGKQRRVGVRRSGRGTKGGSRVCLSSFSLLPSFFLFVSRIL